MSPFGVSACLVGGLWGGDGGGAEAGDAYSSAVSRASCVVVAKRWAATRASRRACIGWIGAGTSDENRAVLSVGDRFIAGRLRRARRDHTRWGQSPPLIAKKGRDTAACHEP